MLKTPREQWGPAIVAAVVLMAGCGLRTPPSILRDRAPFHVHVEQLYAASVHVRAALMLDKKADHLRPLIEGCYREFLFTEDVAAQPEQRRILEAYNDALPALRRGLFQLMNAESFGKIATTSNAGAGNLAARINEYNSEAQREFDDAARLLKEADARYLGALRTQPDF